MKVKHPEKLTGIVFRFANKGGRIDILVSNNSIAIRANLGVWYWSEFSMLKEFITVGYPVWYGSIEDMID